MEIDPPGLARQHASRPGDDPMNEIHDMFKNDPPDLPMLPACWADLAEDDYEMQLMGPPPRLPDNVDAEWAAPKRPARAGQPVPIAPFLETHNQYAALMHRLAPGEAWVEQPRAPSTSAPA